MKRTRTLLALLASLTPVGEMAGAAAPGPAARPTHAIKTGVLKVFVKSKSGKAMIGSLVEITRSGGEGRPIRRTTDSQGRIELTGLAPDQYLVVAFNADMTDFDWRLVTVKPGDATAVFLSPPAPAN